MEETIYQYPVLLQCDQGPEKLKDLKNKLLLYFGIKRQSDGGDCEIRDTDCNQGQVIIYFRDKEAQQRVLQKKTHRVPLQVGIISVDASPAPDNTQNMGGVLSPSASSDDDGAFGSSADTGHQHENNHNQDNLKRKVSSTTDPDPGNGDSKRPADDSTEGKDWDSGADGKKHNVTSSAPKSLTEDYEHDRHQYSRTPRNESRRNSDDGAPGSSPDTDHQQGNNRNTKHWGRSHSLTDRSSIDGGLERPDGDSIEQKQRENLIAFGRTDGKGQDMDSSAPKSLTEIDTSKSLERSSTPGNESRWNPLRRPSSREEPGKNHPSVPPEIFSRVAAKLDKEWFTKTLQEHIEAKIPSLSVKNESDFVELIGTFEEIKRVHSYLQGKLKFSEEKPADTPSDCSPTDSQADQVCCPSALCEYIMEIYRTEMDQIERKYGVKIAHRSAPDGSTSVRFISQGSESLPEKAKETFTDKVQKVMGDWSQVIVDSSVTPLAFSDIKERVKARWSKTLVIQEENKGIILRGPGDELSQVKMFLEKADHKPARPRRAVNITGNMRTEMEVDARHMDILKKLKHKEISDIEKKYNVNMEEKKKTVSSLVAFRSVNAPPDLSPHASHSFITLLQKTFFNIEKKEIRVKPEFPEERVSMVQEQLTMAGIDIVMEYSGGTVLLIGNPVHVAFAEEKLSGRGNSGRGQAAAASGEKTDTDSPSAATQKAEEPDKCPVCLSEIEDKVILEKCKHAYCRDCLKQATAHKPVCAICGDPYGTVIGDQPDGTMNVNTNKYSSLPGYPGCGTIEIYYIIPSGIQKENHPRPGKYFSGTSRTAYLPDNKEGKEILSLLRKAFDQRLIFTVGDSRTTSATDTVTWNDIHHKTYTHGGPQNFGYPDPEYLKRVRDELKAKGVE